MERSPVRDFVVGVFVLVGLAAIAWLSIDVGGFKWHGKKGMTLHAKFTETGGLNVRAPVVIAGVQVGEVTKITLFEDEKGYRALVEMDVRPDLHLPTDTWASVYTAGMLGDRFISLAIGADDKMLKSGDEIAHTEPGVILEQIMHQLVYGLTKDSSSSTTKPSGSSKDTLHDPFQDVLKKKGGGTTTSAPSTEKKENHE